MAEHEVDVFECTIDEFGKMLRKVGIKPPPKALFEKITTLVFLGGSKPVEWEHKKDPHVKVRITKGKEQGTIKVEDLGETPLRPEEKKTGLSEMDLEAAQAFLQEHEQR